MIAAFDGLVLAGGRSTRMGCDKAGLVLEGRTLLDRHIGLLRQLGADRVMVSRAVPGDVPGADGVLVDREPGRGPVEGLALALGACRNPHLLVVAVDLPGLDVEWGREILVRAASGLGVVPKINRGWEPLAALYPVESARELEARILAGQFGLQGWLDGALVSGWLTAWEPGPEAVRWFRNVNTPEDWQSIGGAGSG